MSVDLVGAVLSSVLGGSAKQSRNATRFLGRGGSVINARTLMAAAGLAWGAYESWQAQQAATAAGVNPRRSGASVPPLPAVGRTGAPGESAVSTARLLRLAVAAANADGSMSNSERAAIAEQAKLAGASDAVVSDLRRPETLSAIVSGATDAREKTTLYVLAFTIVRADEQVSGAERIFLAQLANLLGLDAEVVAGLEKSIGEGIDAEGA